MQRRRRATDNPVVEIAMTVVGTAIIGAAIALAAYTPADRWVILGIAVLGGILIPHSRVVAAIAAWRRPDTQADPAPPTPTPGPLGE